MTLTPHLEIKAKFYSFVHNVGPTIMGPETCASDDMNFGYIIIYNIIIIMIQYIIMISCHVD